MSGNYNKKRPRKNQHKGLKIMAIVLAVFIILGALGTSMAFNVLQYRENQALATPEKPDPGNVDDNPTKPNPDDVIIKPGQPDDNNPTPSENGIALLFIEPDAAVLAADSTVTTLVTVTPDVPTAQCTISWSIAFKNPNSTWANKKSVSAYATVTPTAPGALTANIDVLKPFGEQIIVTAALADNADIKVTCTVDYVKRYSIGNPEDWTYNMGTAVYNSFGGTNEQVFGKKGSSVEISPIVSVGTIDEDYKITISITPNAKMRNFIQSFIRKCGEYILPEAVEQLWSATSTTLGSGNALLKVPFEGMLEGMREGGQKCLLLAPVIEYTASDEVYMFRFLNIGLQDNVAMPFLSYKNSIYTQVGYGSTGFNIRTAFHATAAENEFKNSIELADPTCGTYVFNDFFDIKVKLTSAHSSENKTISSSLYFAMNLPTASSLEIDPPSIIV